MAMDSKQKAFADEMAGYIQTYAPKYNIAICSPILAQACLESGWGTSELAVNANNYFGLKYREKRCPTACGTYVKIGSEQNADGSYHSDVMEWFKFASRKDCVIGYFDFTNTPNYLNLKGVTSPEQYLKNIRADKYASSLDYVSKVMNVLNLYNLTQYDKVLSPLYSVQVGKYTSRKDAEETVKKLNRAGFQGVIVESKSIT